MFSIRNNMELKKVTVSSLITCIYLPSVITVISFNDLLYTLGKRSSCFMLGIIFVAEFLKVLYLRDSSVKKNKLEKKRASDILKSIVFLLLNVMIYFIVIILFGAPVLDKHEETLNLAALLVLLTTYPLVAHVGVEMALQLLLGVKEYNRGTVIEMFVNNSLLAICGAWIGAVVIPLDWNTPWQEWPIPCYLGILGGYILSNVLTIVKIILISAANKYPGINKIVNIVYKYPVIK